MAAFDRGRGTPSNVTYRSVENPFEMDGWRVAVDRLTTEFDALARTGSRGFTLRGSGTGHVVTPAAYGAHSTHTVTVGRTTHVLRADRDGRLHITVPLGAANPCQQYRPGCRTRTHSTAVDISPGSEPG